MTNILIKPKTEKEYILIYELLTKMQVDFEKMNQEENSPIDIENEREEWFRFAVDNFAKGYSDNEPDYENVMIKEPNPEYKAFRNECQ